MPRVISKRGGEDFRVEQNIATSRVQIHAHVEPEVRAELVELARRDDRSVSSVIRAALSRYVADQALRDVNEQADKLRPLRVNTQGGN
jgi:Ribbon-helix-helix protein, copG family